MELTGLLEGWSSGVSLGGSEVRRVIGSSYWISWLGQEERMVGVRCVGGNSP